MIYVKDILKSEFYKYRKSLIVLISFIIPLLICIYTFFNFYKIMEENPNSGINPWILVFGFSFKLIPFLYSIFAIYIVQDNLNKDFSNNTYDILFTFPAKRLDIYISKVLLVFLILTFSISILYLFLIIGINLFEFTLKENKFYEYGSDSYIIFTYSFFRLLLYTFLVSVLQLNINRINRSPVINIIAPILLSLLSSILVFWKAFKIFPYSFIYNITLAIDLNGKIQDFYIDILALLLISLLIFAYTRNNIYSKK